MITGTLKYVDRGLGQPIKGLGTYRPRPEFELPELSTGHDHNNYDIIRTCSLQLRGQHRFGPTRH